MTRPTTIGILSPLVSGHYFGSLIRGVHAAARERGAGALAIQTRDGWALHSEFGRPVERVSSLAWDQVDGWVVTVEAVSPEYLRALRRSGKPLVTISAPIPELDCPTVLPDNRQGAMDAVRHLLDHGHRRIAFVGYLGQSDIRERYAGYQAALAERGIAPDPALLFPADDNEDAGGRAAGQLLLAAGVPCTAVVAATDMNAIAVMDVLQSAGLRVPQDIAVVGFDDIDAAQYAVPALTTVRQRFDSLGHAAGALVLDALTGAQVAPGPHYVPCTFLTRRSCGCAPCAPAVSLPVHSFAPAAEWQDRLAEELVRIALHPAQPAPGMAVARLWPGVARIIAALQSALQGEMGPSERDVAYAWDEAVQLNPDFRALRAVVARLRDAGSERLPADPAARDRLEAFVEASLSEVVQARLRAETARSTYYEAVVQQNHEVSQALLETRARGARGLAWLDKTSTTHGCLGLWHGTGAGQPAELEVVGVFSRNGGPAPERGERYAAQQFPPSALLAESAGNEAQILMLFPVWNAHRDWGVLALVGPIETALSSGRGARSQWTALLSSALEREELMRSLEEQQSSLREAYERERMLADTVRELGSPVIPLLPQMLLIPLVGTIDTGRAMQLMDAVLHGVSQHRATEVLLDITGVPLVDTQVANSLIEVTRAATLLGARVTLVGVRPEIAQSMVSLGISLTGITTRPTLSVALEMLLRRRA
ncbi:MAG TPA: substrate-binding domain-containing protein [Roseiflexaceae bacterium]|nr:substrate-binding domain-containing protein [Roseiflexaceae bacterium]